MSMMGFMVAKMEEDKRREEYDISDPYKAMVDLQSKSNSTSSIKGEFDEEVGRTITKDVPLKFDGDLIRYLEGLKKFSAPFSHQMVQGNITSVDYAIRLYKALPWPHTECEWYDSMYQAIVDCFCVELFTAKEPTVESIKNYIQSSGGKENVDMTALSAFTKQHDNIRNHIEYTEGISCISKFMNAAETLYQRMYDYKMQAREDYIQKLMEDARNI